ncbi:MAG: bifunctional nuclease family protein [Cyanobacteria bacterium SIG29]|nr:bifunctional nuclease family protein [Cyanobacteria bacterium SIG29]
MIEMKVMGIAIDTASGSPIIVLNDKDNRKALPIWIGSAEASAIIRKIENIKVIRPMTHDLIIDVVNKTGYRVSRIEINDVEKDTYFATIFLTNDEENEVTIDARPSDAIAVAIRVDAPIYVSAKVLADGSVSCDNEKDEAESQEFKNFIQSIKPSDFEKLLKDDKQSDQ